MNTPKRFPAWAAKSRSEMRPPCHGLGQIPRPPLPRPFRLSGRRLCVTHATCTRNAGPARVRRRRTPCTRMLKPWFWRPLSGMPTPWACTGSTTRSASNGSTGGSTNSWRPLRTPSTPRRRPEISPIMEIRPLFSSNPSRPAQAFTWTISTNDGRICSRPTRDTWTRPPRERFATCEAEKARRRPDRFRMSWPERPESPRWSIGIRMTQTPWPKRFRRRPA